MTRLLNHMRETGLRQATPVNSDAEVTASPLLGLNSGYVTRSADKFPKQGSKFPWQVHQSYLKDYRALKMRGTKTTRPCCSRTLPIHPAGALTARL